MIVVNVKCKGERYLLGATQGFVLGKVVLLCTFSLIRKVSNICILFVHVNLGLTASPGGRKKKTKFFFGPKTKDLVEIRPRKVYSCWLPCAKAGCLLMFSSGLALLG